MLDITEIAHEGVNHMLSRVESAKLSTGVRSKPVLGLPVRRVIPQDIHSVLDYAGGAAGLAAAVMANTARARMANRALSSASTGVSLFTDYKLSIAKIIPIEVHEVIDYVWGISNIAAPFALGYYKKDKAVAIANIALGIGVIAASLFTDYRGYRASRRTSRSRPQASSRSQAKRKRG